MMHDDLLKLLLKKLGASRSRCAPNNDKGQRWLRGFHLSYGIFQ